MRLLIIWLCFSSIAAADPLAPRESEPNLNAMRPIPDPGVARKRKDAFIRAGLGVFGASYTATAVPGLVFWYSGLPELPVFGPFVLGGELARGTREFDPNPMFAAALFLDGTVQLSGLLMAIIAATRKVE
jgi:hypothetical protein